MKAKSPKKRGRGRPTRAEASAAALANIDVSTVDPRAILSAIAADPSAPATARVGACRALLSPAAEPRDAEGPDAITRRALEILQKVRR